MLDQLHMVEDPEEQETILTPEEEETYPHSLQGAQRDEAAQDLSGLERRDGRVNPVGSVPCTFQRVN